MASADAAPPLERESFPAFSTRMLAIVGMIVILDFFGFLEELDDDAHNIAFNIQLRLQPESPSLAGMTDIPHTFTLSDRLFETELREMSPLNKWDLNKIVTKILQHKPAVLSFDLDISPSYCLPQPDKDTCEKNHPLYETLTKATKQTQIVLPTPFPVTTREAYDTKKRWMADMCAGGVSFAYPELYFTQGNEIKITPSLPTIASVTDEKRHLLNKPEFPPICNDLLQKVENDQDDREPIYFPDILLNLGDETPGFFESRLHYRNLFSVDWRLYRAVMKATTPIHQLDQTFVSEEIRNKAVFLGGSYGQADEFNTPFGMTDGVYLHALAFASLNKLSLQHSPWRMPLILVGFSFIVYFITRFKKYPSSHPPVEELLILTFFSILLFITVSVISGLANHELPAAQLTLLLILLTETHPDDAQHIDPLKHGARAFLATREAKLRLSFIFLAVIILFYN